jgi:hypothetical protein
MAYGNASLSIFEETVMLRSETLLRQALAYDKLASLTVSAVDKMKFFRQRDQSIIAAKTAASKGE